MKTIFNKSLDLQDMKNILANIDDLTEVYKNGQAKCEAMELDLKHRLEFDELTDEQMLHVGRGLQKVLRRRREYKDEIRKCETVALCGFYSTSDETEKVRRFNGAVNAANRQRLYSAKVSPEWWTYDDDEFFSAVKGTTHIPETTYGRRDGTYQLCYKSHESINKIFNKCRT